VHRSETISGRLEKGVRGLGGEEREREAEMDKGMGSAEVWILIWLSVDEERIMCQDWPTTARATLLISILQLNNRLRDFLDIYFYLILFLSFLLKVFLCLGRLNSPRIGSCICKSRSIWII
jgi:hypothetical protein